MNNFDQPKSEFARCRDCGAKIAPDGDRDWNYCYRCMGIRLDDARRARQEEACRTDKFESEDSETFDMLIVQLIDYLEFAPSKTEKLWGEFFREFLPVSTAITSSENGATGEFRVVSETLDRMSAFKNSLREIEEAANKSMTDELQVDAAMRLRLWVENPEDFSPIDRPTAKMVLAMLDEQKGGRTGVGSDAKEGRQGEQGYPAMNDPYPAPSTEPARTLYEVFKREESRSPFRAPFIRRSMEIHAMFQAAQTLAYEMELDPPTFYGVCATREAALGMDNVGHMWSRLIADLMTERD